MDNTDRDVTFEERDISGFPYTLYIWFLKILSHNLVDLMAQWLLRYLASLSNQVMSFGHVSSNLTEVEFFLVPSFF